MKKFYMFLAAGFAALGMNAQNLHFTIDGQEVENGSRVDITNFFEPDIFEQDGFVFKSYMIDPKMAIVCDVNGSASATATFNSAESIPTYDWTYGASISLSYCAFDGTCLMVPLHGSQTKTANLTAGVPGSMMLEFMGDIGDDQELDDLKISGECTVDCTFEGHNYSVVLFFNTDNAGVKDATVDLSKPAVYYDLQGRQVSNPGAGLYIVRHGNKVTKTFIK